jgi:uncharacterized protein
MRKITKTAIVLDSMLLVFAVWFFFFSGISNPFAKPAPTAGFPSGTEITIEIADSYMEQVQGLSDRVEMDWDHGMLFIYDFAQYQNFWMKDMYIPLDIIWINGNEVIGIESNVLPERPVETIYSSKVPVDKVLEVNAGFAEDNGLKPGDILDIKLPN